MHDSSCTEEQTIQNFYKDGQAYSLQVYSSLHNAVYRNIFMFAYLCVGVYMWQL